MGLLQAAVGSTGLPVSGTLNGWSNYTVGSTKTIDPGFDPKLVIFFYCGQQSATDANSGGDGHWGIGAASATDERHAVGFFADDAADPSDSVRHASNAAAIIGRDAGARAGLADVTSMAAGTGFTMTIDEEFTAPYHVGYLALGGDMFAKVGQWQETASGSLAETGTGFKPTGLFTFSALNSDNGTAHCLGGIGAAAGASSEHYLGWTEQDNVATNANAVSYFYAGELAARMWTSIQNRTELTSFDSDGFTLNVLEYTAATYHKYASMARVQCAVGSFDTRTDTNTITVSGLAFQPTAVLLFSGCKTAFDAQDTLGNDIKISIGAYDGTNQMCHAFTSQDGVAPEYWSAVEYDEAYVHGDLADGIDAKFAFTGLTSDGFTGAMDGSFLESSARKVVYMAIGPYPTATIRHRNDW